MKLTKILSFDDEELTALTQAGKILGAMANRIKEIKEAAPTDKTDTLKLDENSTKMIEALYDVIQRL